jgi:methylaspartate mutase sigma subunit
MNPMPTIVTGVIGTDVHCIGIKLVEYALKQEGFTVVSLGIHNSQEDFINAAIETSAAAVFVSSLYGHAELDCRNMRQKCQEAGIGDILLYLGGILAVTSQAQWPDVEKRFKAMKFDRVYPPRVRIRNVMADLKTDLGLE